MSEKQPKEQAQKPKMGRPTKYTPEICQRMVDYFNTELYEIKQKKVKSKFGETIQEYAVPCRLPTFERFSVLEDLANSTIKLWREKHPDFSAAYEKCKNIQKEILMHHGLTGNYNAAFAKFVAINCTDMREQVDHNIDANLKINELDIDKKDKGVC